MRRVPVPAAPSRAAGRVLRRLLRPQHLRRTALVVGSWLTLLNHGAAVLTAPDPGLIAKVALNYLTPFVVANLGLVSAEDPPADGAPGGGRNAQGTRRVH